MLRTTNRFLPCFSLQTGISPSHSIRHPQHHWVPRKRELKLNRSKAVWISLSFAFWPTEATGVQFVQNMGNCSSVKRDLDFLPCQKFGREHEDPCFKLHFCQRFPSIFTDNPKFRTTFPIFPYYFSYLFLLFPLCRWFT